MTTKKTVPSISIESQEIVKLLLDAKEGQIVTYDEMNKKLLDGDVRDGKRYALYTAMRVLLREHERVFQVVRGEGVRLASGTEVIDEAEQGLKIVHRRMRRDMRKLSVVEYEALSKDDKVRHNARMSQLGAIGLMTSTQRTKAIEGKVKEAGERLNITDTIRLFAK